MSVVLGLPQSREKKPNDAIERNSAIEGIVDHHFGPNHEEANQIFDILKSMSIEQLALVYSIVFNSEEAITPSPDGLSILFFNPDNV